MNYSWLFYDYFRRWGLLVLLGLAVGGLLGFGYYQQHDKKPRFTAIAVMATSETVRFNVVSPDLPNPQDAVDNILTTIKQLDAEINTTTEVKDLSITSRYRVVIWKTIAVGSVLGGLVAIGIAYLWDDARTYQRRRYPRESADE